MPMYLPRYLLTSTIVTYLLLLPQPRQPYRDNQQHANNRKSNTAHERNAHSGLVAPHDLLPDLQIGNLRDGLDALAHLLDQLRLPLGIMPVFTNTTNTTTISDDEQGQVSEQRVLEDQATSCDTQDAAERPPQHQGAGDDGLVALLRRRQHRQERAGELEPLPHRGRRQAQQVRGHGPASAHRREHDRADEVEPRPEGEGPLQAPRPRDQEPRHGSAYGRDRRGDHEVET